MEEKLYLCGGEDLAITCNNLQGTVVGTVVGEIET